MESPVVVDKPPEYHGNAHDNDKGFPFDDEEGREGAWSELAARHPDIAARLRARPSAWARKRRSSHNQPDSADDFTSSLGEHFNRFPFDDIPPEFREHFPSHWGNRFGAPERTHSHSQSPTHHTAAQPQQKQPQPQAQQQTTSTQTEYPSEASSTCKEETLPSASLPQYGLRNTVDLGQKTPIDPSLVDAEDGRNQRSMSAPPDNRVPTPNHTMGNMMGGNTQPPPQNEQHVPAGSMHSNVRHIPIFVEGRDEPVINKSVDHGDHKPTYVPPPDRDQYFAERDVPVGFHHPPNFSRAFGTPFNKGFRQGPQPYAQQKVYPQGSYTAQNVPPQERSESPKPHMQHPQQPSYQVPVHHQQPSQNKPTPSQPNQVPPPQQPPHQQAPPQQPPQQASPQEPPTQPQGPSPNDPISKILNIQKDVLDLMTEVENFTGKKADKRYIYLDEMLTRNLIKLDDIETEGKENIRQARREAIKCIQKCIAVLEAKADGKLPHTPVPQDSDMKENINTSEQPHEDEPNNQQTDEKKEEEPQLDSAAKDIKEDSKIEPTDNNEVPTEEAGKPNVKKGTKKVVKKRDKSKDKKDGAEVKKEETQEGAKADKKENTEKAEIPSNEGSTEANIVANDEKQKKDEQMQVDEKGDSGKSKGAGQPMEVEGSPASSQ